jgi:hypothetical protein
MTTPRNERQEWLDFAHTVDVLSASALATSDLADTPGHGEKTSGGRARLRGIIGSSGGRRAIGGVLAVACLLVLAIPVSRVLETLGPGSGQLTQQGDRLNPGVETIRPFGDGRPLPIELQVVQPKTTFQAGEPVSFTLQTNKDCHLLIYSIGANNEVTILAPAPSAVVTGDFLLKADVPLQIPPPNAQGPAITAPSPGTYTIGALCSSETLPGLGTSAALLGDAARRGGPAFLSYLADVASRARSDQLAETRLRYEVK